jgi:hypothetical protein
LISAFYLGCAGANRPPETGGPRPLTVEYPIKYQVSKERTDAVVAAWSALAVEQGFAPQPLPQFDPTTGTVASLPAGASGGLKLPLVGSSVMSEDDEREALKRFLETVEPLLGTQRAQLTLIDTDRATTTNVATYEQRPYRYPIRNGFGRVRVVYTSTRQVRDLNSTALPELQTVNRDLNEVRGSVRPEQVTAALAGQTVSWTDKSGTHQLFIPADRPVIVGESVIFPIKSESDNGDLELHLAWEVRWPDSTSPPFYVDVVTLKVLGGSI